MKERVKFKRDPRAGENKKAEGTDKEGTRAEKEGTEGERREENVHQKSGQYVAPFSGGLERRSEMDPRAGNISIWRTIIETA